MSNGISTRYANSVFEQPWWLDTVAPMKWKEIYIEKEDEIIARWAFCYVNNRIVMPILTQTCSPWFKLDCKQNEREQREDVKKAIYELLEKVTDFSSVSISLDVSTNYFLPFYWKGFQIKPCVTYRIIDLEDLNKVFYNFSKNIRRDIKAAEKKLHISYEPSAEILYNVMEKTFAEQKRKYPIAKEVIERIIQNSINNHAGQMLSALDENGNVHAAAFFLYDKQRCYYLIGGKDATYKNNNGLTLLIWEGIKFAASVSKEFDFEGSMIEGIENYFKRFGGVPKVYYHVSRQGFWADFFDMIKPRIKRIIGYKI